MILFINYYFIIPEVCYMKESPMLRTTGSDVNPVFWRKYFNIS